MQHIENFEPAYVYAVYYRVNRKKAEDKAYVMDIENQPADRLEIKKYPRCGAD